MAGRGRGRGSGGGLTYEQLQSLGVGRGEGPAPASGGIPPPLFPKLETRPLPLESNATLDYLLILKRQFIDHLHDSPCYVQTPTLQTDVERYSDKYKVLSSESKGAKGGVGGTCWECLPSELRPHHSRKVSAKKRKVKMVDIDTKLKKLEQLEMKSKEKEGVVPGEEDGGEEKVGEEGLDEEILEDPDEEMDDGTDYVDNYFDNGEGFEDDDENLDDGPVY